MLDRSGIWAECVGTNPREPKSFCGLLSLLVCCTEPKPGMPFSGWDAVCLLLGGRGGFELMMLWRTGDDDGDGDTAVTELLFCS